MSIPPGHRVHQHLPTMRRVFVPLYFLLGLAILVGSLGAIWLLYALFMDGWRIRGGGWARILLVLAAAPFVGLAVMIASFFARGCSACRRDLEQRKYRFPPTMYAFLAEQLARGGPHLGMFLRAPIETGPCAAELVVHTCSKCERLAAVELTDVVPGRRDNPETGERWLTPEELPWIAALRETRPCSE